MDITELTGELRNEYDIINDSQILDIISCKNSGVIKNGSFLEKMRQHEKTKLPRQSTFVMKVADRS